jgi:hypothetical protein
VSPAVLAQRQQHVFDRRDAELTRRARRRRPRIKHWWGRRWQGRQNGAYCYLCNDFIATWSSRWPITEQARQLIAWHREDHLLRRLDGREIKPEE